MKHPIYPAAVDDRIRCAVGLDGQVTTIQDVQVSAAVGVFARSPHQGDGVPIDRGGKGNSVGAGYPDEKIGDDRGAFGQRGVAVRSAAIGAGRGGSRRSGSRHERERAADPGRVS